MADTPDVIAWRVTQLEDAVKTMAIAAQRQQQFNSDVEKFMASVKTWGFVALLVYGLGQALLVGAILLAAQRLL